MAANKHTNKLKIQNYAYEINDSGALVQATTDGNYFEIPNESYFGRNGDYPLIEAMDIDWRPYDINGTPVVTTHDVLNNISQNIDRLDYLDDAYTYTMDIIEENEEITAQALTNLDTRVLNIENVDLPDLDGRVETLETTYVSHEFLSNIGYVKIPMSYTEYGYAKLGRNTNITIGGRVYPIGMEASTGRLGVEIPYQPGDNTITTITPSAEGSGNYVKEIKLSHVDNNPILSYTLTVSYATLPTLSATGTNTGLVINGISASEHSITYSYTNVPSYEYIANNYETITYVRDAYTYIMDNIEENEYVTAQALTDLDTRVTNIEDDYVAYSDLNSYIGAHSYITHAQVNDVLASYINYGTATNTGYVIGKIGMNGHTLSYAYVAVPTYEYLHNGYVNNVTSTKSGSGNIVKEITVSKTTTGGINSYVINVAYSSIAATDTYTYVKLQNGANDSGKYVSGIEMNYSGSNPTSYEFKVSYTDLPSVSFDNNAATTGQAATGFKINTTDDHKIQVSYSYFANPKYLADFSYVNKVQGNGSGNVINAIKQNGQTVTYAYGTVFDTLSGTKGDNNIITNITASGNTISITYATAQSLITIPDIPTNSYIKNVGIKGTGSTSYTITLSYTYGSGTNSTSSVTIPEANGTTAGVVKVTSQYHYTPNGGTTTNSGSYVNESIEQKAITGITITKDDKGHVTGFSYIYTAIPSYTYINKRLTDLIGAAPQDLDTLKELADALGQDPNFATTITNMIGDVKTNMNSYINGIEVGGGNDTGYKITISYHVGDASNTQTKNVTIPVMSTSNYGVAKLGDSTSLTIGSKVYGVGKTSDGKLAVSVPWDDNTNDNDNTISYVTHKGNGSGNAINGIIVTHSGTNPVSYTVTYSYTTFPTYIYLKQSYVSYTNFNSYIASLGYVNKQMTTSSYGYAKLGNSDTLTIGNKIYGVGITSSGQLAVQVPWENTVASDSYQAANYTSGLKISTLYSDGEAQSSGHLFVPEAGTTLGLVKSGSGDGKATIANGIITYTDSKVTSADNHYTPSGTNQTITAGTGSNLAFGGKVVSEISYARDNKGHVTSISYTLSTLPSETSLNVTGTKGTNNVVVGVKKGTNSHDLEITYGSVPTFADISGLSYLKSYSYVGFGTTTDNDNSGFKINLDKFSYTVSDGTLTRTANAKSITIPKMDNDSYGVAKAKGGTNGTKFVGISNDGFLTYTDTNDNDNTISYVTHKGNGTGNFINGIIVTKSGTNPVTYTVTYSYGTALTSESISNFVSAYYDVLTKGTYPATNALQVGKGYRNDATKTSSSYSAYSYSDIYVPYMTSSQYGVAKLGDSTTLTIGSTSTDTTVGVGMNSSGQLAVKIPKAEQSQDTNNISYVVHQGNGTGNVITGISVTHSGTNPVTYTVAYSYGTAYSKLEEHKIDGDNGVASITGNGDTLIIQYDTFLTEHQSLANYVTKTDLSAQCYVSSVMTDTTFGYAKVGAPGTINLTDPNIYPVAITANGQLGVEVDIDDTFTYVQLNTIQNTGAQVVVGLQLTSNTGTNPITYTLKASYVDINELVSLDDNYHDAEFDNGLLIGSAQGSIDDLYVPYMTNTQYGVAKSYYTYNGQVAVSNDTRNYGLSIDNQGHAYVNVPWVGGEVQLQSSTTGTVVSNITKNGNVLTISYTNVPDETQLINAITELNDRIDDMFGYIETGNGKALHYDPQSGAAYVDLTGFSGGGGGGTSSINSVAFTSTNTGSQLTINDGSNHVGTLNVMTNTSYGVAKARVFNYIQSQEEYQTGKGIGHISDLDPNDPEVKNYMVKIFSSYQPYGQSGNTNMQGHMFVSIPISDIGSGGGSGSGGGDTITAFSNAAATTGRTITITTDQTTHSTTLPKASTSAYGLVKVKSNYSSNSPSAASSGNYYPVQMALDGVGVVRVPTSTGSGTGGDTITNFTAVSQTDSTGGSLLTITTNATSWTARVPKATSSTYGLIKAGALSTNVSATTAGSGDYYNVQVKPNGEAVVRVPAGGSGSGTNAVQWEANSGVTSSGPVKKIKVVSSAGTDINTLYIVI